MKKIWIFMFALLAIVSCKDDDPKPATAEQLQKLTGHWYAELPANGETANWRTLEEGDMTTYDHIGVVIYLNGNTPTEEVNYWGYLYLQEGDMVNYAGLMSESHEQSSFSFTMDEEYNITPSSHLKDAPQVTSMHWDNTKDVITADVNYKGQTFKLTFKRVNLNEEQTLKDFYDILAEEGIVGGYADLDTQLNTDVSDNDATGPSRVRRL